MSNLKYWISVFSVLAVTLGCGGGDDKGNPDASSPDGPDSGQTGNLDAGNVGVVSCADYCTAVTANCTGANAQYPDTETCLALCEAAGWEVGQAGAKDGNTIACRAYHASAPAVTDADTYCAHAGPTGGNTCGTWCDVYCALNLTMCTGRNAQYTDDAACRAACANFADTGEAGDDMGDTVQCRIFHSGYLASRNPGEECTYTGEDPVNYCIDVSF